MKTTTLKDNNLKEIERIFLNSDLSRQNSLECVYVSKDNQFYQFILFDEITGPLIVFKLRVSNNRMTIFSVKAIAESFFCNSVLTKRWLKFMEEVEKYEIHD